MLFLHILPNFSLFNHEITKALSITSSKMHLRCLLFLITFIFSKLQELLEKQLKLCKDIVPTSMPILRGGSSKQTTILRVPSEADGFSWKKHGQKVPKGSIYPRLYYKCDWDLSCPVRKKVQRCAEDVNTWLIAYEGDHNHPLPPGVQWPPAPPAGTNTTPAPPAGTNTTPVPPGTNTTAAVENTMSLDLTL